MDNIRIKISFVLIGFLFLITGCFHGPAPIAGSGPVQVVQTSANGSSLLEEQPSLSFVDLDDAESITIDLDLGRAYQTMSGFGFALPQGSAEVLMSLEETQLDQILNELFHPTEGLNISIIRLPIGASDLTFHRYTYNEVAGDEAMENFSLDGTPDAEAKLVILQRILQINPDIKILATPWTAPTWMKVGADPSGYIGGELDPRYHEAYALYFVKYLQAMEQRGFSIWAVTPQNEPLHDGNNPSMYMTASQQHEFVDSHLGPALEEGGLGHVKIIAYDHNCDRPEYPIEVAKSSYVDGSAFHLYDWGANIQAMSHVREATGKEVFFTEQYVNADPQKGNFAGDFDWHMKNVVMGSISNWSSSVVEWNLVTLPKRDDYLLEAPLICEGALTWEGELPRREVSYYIIGQLSSFIQSGALRIHSESSHRDIMQNSFLNPDGTVAVVVYNQSSFAKSFTVSMGDQGFSYKLPGKSCATFTWDQSESLPSRMTMVEPQGNVPDADEGIPPHQNTLEAHEVNHALQLNPEGVGDDYVELSVFQLSTNAGLTIESWVRWDELTSNAALFSFSDARDQNKLYLKLRGDRPDLVLGSQSGGRWHEGDMLAENFIEPGQWFHMAVVISPRGELTLYKNGEVVAIDRHATGARLVDSVPLDHVYIGKPIWGDHENFSGAVDEFRIWEGVRSSEEIAQFMNLPLENPAEIDLLKLYYKFNGIAGELQAREEAGEYEGSLRNMNGDQWIESPFQEF